MKRYLGSGKEEEELTERDIGNKIRNSEGNVNSWKSKVILVVVVLVNLEGRMGQKETSKDHSSDFRGIMSLLNQKIASTDSLVCATTKTALCVAKWPYLHVQA